MEIYENNRTLVERELSFTRLIVRENALDRDGFDAWAFRPGMLFGGREQWWGSGRQRNYPHEGVDFLFYRNRSGSTARLGPETRVPVMRDGTVVAIVKDFLGQSVFVVHRVHECGRPLLSIYGHTLPFGNVREGTLLKEGEILGTLSASNDAGAAAPPHLHVSLAWAASLDACAGLDWSKINDPALVALIDPLPIVGGPYVLI